MTPKCKREDCNEPRLISSSGVLQTYCEKHQREYWRETARAKRPANQPPLNDSIGDNGTTIEAAHANVARTSRLSDAEREAILAGSRTRVEAKQVATLNPVEQKTFLIQRTLEEAAETAKIFEQMASEIRAEALIPVPINITKPDECALGCNDCLYRDIVELLEKRVPGVRDIVTGLKKTVSGQT